MPRERRCIVTGETPPEAELVRFALSAEGEVVADVAAKLPGRGAWVRARRAVVDQAVRRNAFARAFKTAAKPPPDLSDRTGAALTRSALALLGLSRKASAVAIGYEQVETAIRAGRALLLIEAADGSGPQREKLRKLAFGLSGREPAVVAGFSADELGVALGRDRVIHAAWLQERMARRWADEIERLSGFRADISASWPPAFPAGGEHG